MKSNKLFLSCVLISAVLLSCTQKPADLILKNGKIYTGESELPWVETIVITGQKITKLLNQNDSFDRYVGTNTKIIDLNGKFACSGFIDSHVHFAGFSAQQHDIMLMNVDTDEGLIAELERVTELIGDGEWISGGNWSGAILWENALGEISDNMQEERWMPNRFVIDDVTAKNPCLLSSYQGDLYLANSLALKEANLEDNPLKGMEIRDGIITGLIYNGSPALEIIRGVIKRKSEERILNEYRAGLAKMREMGIVEIHDMIRSFDELDRYLTLQQSGELTCRIWIRPWLDLAPSVYEQGYKMGHHPITGERDHFLRFGSMKSANDGFLGDRGAMLFEPYTDRPDYKGHYQEYNSDSETFGSLVGNPQVFYDYCKSAVEHGFSVDAHAIGDRGISEVIDVWEQIQKDLNTDMSMFRVIHAEIVQPREFDRIKALNVIVETNPSQIPDDMRWLIDRLGPEREKLAFPFRTFLDKGIKMNFGSDVPGNAGAIFFNHPKYVLNAAVNRTDTKGKPEGGWTTHHKISMEEAIKCFTLNGAYGCMGEDQIRGSLKIGKLADITVCNMNILENPDEVLQMEIEMTIVDGRIVYER